MGLTTPLPYPVFVEAEFSEDLFLKNAFEYNHALARIACILSDVSYVDANANENALCACYRTLGIHENDIFLDYSPVYQKDDNDNAAYSFALLRTKNEPVVIVVIRGTPLSANEWISNLNIADSSKQEEIFHEGFKKSTERILPHFRHFLKDKQIEPKNARFLITGHSRGAAIANLFAAELSVLESSSGENMFDTQKIFAFTFATPNVTTSQNANDEKFGYIWNIESEEDIVQSIPPERGEWRFKKFGNIKMLPSRWKDSAEAFFQKKEKMDEIFESIMLRKYEPFGIGAFVPIQVSRLLTKLNGTVSSYYGFFGIRNADWIFWKIFPENPKEKKKENAETAKSNITKNRFSDMHTCETYLSWMLSLDENDLFGNAGSIEVRIKGSADFAVLSESGTILATAKNGHAEYNSVFSPVGVLSYFDRSFLGLPEIEPFSIIVQKESIFPTPVRISVSKYDEKGILIGKTDEKKLWLHAGGASVFPSGEKIEAEKSLRRGWKLYASPEISFAPTKELLFGLNAGTRHVHALVLFSPPIVKDKTSIRAGLATEANVWARFFADFAFLCNFSWENGERDMFPSARVSISFRPVRRFEFFGGATFDFADFPDDFSSKKAFSFGVRF